MTIALHTGRRGRGPARRPVHPVNGAIDALMAGVEPRHRRAGFDARGTPFGDLAGDTSSYAIGRDDFVLADFCDGYVLQAAFTEHENVRPIPGFINGENVGEAKQRMPNPKFRTGLWSHLGPDSMNRHIATNGNVEDLFAVFE